MKIIPNIQQVIENDHCITCGACIQVCPPHIITSSFSKERMAYEVKITNPEKCTGCSAPCDQVCPSIETNFMKLLGTNGRPVPAEGPIKNVYLGYSEKDQVNGISSSGGIVRKLIHKAIQEGDPVICLTRQGTDYLPETISRESDLMRIPGSIYHSIDFNDAIRLLKQVEKPAILVATPCQLAGIRNYIIDFEPQLEQKVKFTIGLICGWSFSHHSIEALKVYKKIIDPVTDVRYRGEDQIGNLKIYTEKRTYIYSRSKHESFKQWIDYRAAFSRTLNRLRCRVCMDHTNILADISVGDAWIKRTWGNKLSVIVSRNQRGEEAIQQLMNFKDIHIERTSVADLIESQSKNLVYGIDARKMTSYLKLKKEFTPRFIFNSGDSNKSELSKAELSHLKFDFYKREIVFKGEYRRYRSIYMFTSLKTSVIEIYVKLKRKIKKFLFGTER